MKANIKIQFVLYALLTVCLFVSCEKTEPEIKAGTNEPVEQDVRHGAKKLDVVCATEASRGPMFELNTTSSTTHLKGNLNENSLNRSKYDFVISSEHKIVLDHIPANALAEVVKTQYDGGDGHYEERQMVVAWLKDGFDENGEDNVLKFHTELTTNVYTNFDDGIPRIDHIFQPYEYTLHRPDIQFVVDYVNEKDSVFFQCDGRMVEYPSTHTMSFMITTRPAYEFKNRKNTHAMAWTNDSWIHIGEERAGVTYITEFSVDANEGPERVGYVYLTDLGGDVGDTIKVRQEGADWKIKQDASLLELSKALYGEEWTESDRIPVGVDEDGRLMRIGGGHDNRVKGYIPECIGDFWKVTEINLRTCSLTGTIPESIGKLRCLKKLDLANNKLTGGFPVGIKNAHGLWGVYIDNNKLSGSIPDWFPFEMPQYIREQETGVDHWHMMLCYNDFTNYDPAKHCGCSTHEGNPYASKPEDDGSMFTNTGFQGGGSTEENF